MTLAVCSNRQVPLPLSEWAVFIPNHHEGYIALDVFEANQQRLRANWRARTRGCWWSGAGGRGVAARSAPVRPMRTQNADHVHRSWRQRFAIRVPTGASHAGCRAGVPGPWRTRLEERIVDAFLAALAPASVDATLAALQETEEAWQRECHQRELLVERARYEAERAERQFTRVEPENRLVARSLERAWEERLNDLAQCQEELDGFRRRRPTPLSQDDAEWLRRAGADLKAVWQAPTTTNRDRKHLLRCLISEVVVLVDRERLVADVTIRWTGGASTKLTSPLNRTGGHRYVTSAAGQ